MLLKRQHNKNKKYHRPTDHSPTIDSYSTKNIDMRNVPSVGTASCKRRDLSRIIPIRCTHEFTKGVGAVKRMLTWAAHNSTKKADFSKAGVARAAASFAVEQSIRKGNAYRSKFGRKRIPINQGTLERERKFLERQGDIIKQREI